MYPAWAVQPLTVAWAPQRFAKCEMSASLLANDQVCSASVDCVEAQLVLADMSLPGLRVPPGLLLRALLNAKRYKFSC